MPTYALQATASFFGDVVEETFVRRGEPLQIGNSDALAVPVPDGAEFIARVDWTGADTATVIDGRGRQYLLGPDDDVALTVGPVTLTLRLVRRFALKRAEPPSARGSLTWLAIVLMATITTQQVDLVSEHACEWFMPLFPGVMSPYCVQPTDQASGPGAFTAEYLARLLKEDYAGSDDGTIRVANDETARKQVESFYMPAGSEGPIEEMGGAAETAPEPVRAPVPEEEPTPPPEPDPTEEPEILAVEDGTPVEDAVEVEPEPQDDGIADLDDVPEPEDEPEVVAPAEEEEGWGVQDWYDARAKELDELEIEVMLRAAQERLRIDPNDPEALSVLSYYQYLAQDYEAAEATYDKFIELFPEESAGYNNKALIYKRRGEYEKEEGLYRVALAIRPNDVTALNNLAVNLAHQGQHEQALQIMEQLETLDPDEPYADLHRAKIHAEMGNIDEALFYLDRSLQGMARLDTLHHIEFRQDIRLDPSFEQLRTMPRFHAILSRYYGDDSPLQE